ncbi:MAG: response regulator [Chloroflexales bacterium]
MNTPHITARGQAEARLNKLNRTYALLSAINQMIVRVRKPNDLFDSACRVAISQGEFRMAWIGRLNPQTMQVRPIAHAGEVADYLENLHIALDNSESARGPTATALYAGKHIVVNDIANDPRMGPWRAAALRLGYRASAAFPLIVAGELFGVLNLYASEPDFFDEDELKLLDEMAVDIAFALEFMSQEEQRQRAEENLRASERHSQLLLKAMPDMMFRLTPEGVILDYSAKEGTDLYVPPAIFINQNLAAVLPPAVADPFQHAVQRAFATEELQTFEYQLAMGGDLRSYEARIVTNTTEHEAVAIIREITTRKRMEHDLQERIKELTCLRQVQSLIEKNPPLDDLCQQIVAYLIPAMQFPDVAVALVDLDGRRYCSSADRTAPERALAADIVTGGVAYGRLTVSYRDDSPFIIPEEQTMIDSVAHSLGLWLERQQSEAALRESEARYRVIFEGASEGIVSMRMADQSLQYANQAICALFGYPHDEFLRLTMRDLHPSEALPQVVAEFEALARAEKVQVSGIPCRRKDGRVFYADIKATEARLDGQEFLVGFFSDITERIHAQDALTEERNSLARRVEERTADLSRANTELTRAVHTKDEFLANMSHELRTPLNAILALSEGLLEQFRGPLNARQQDSIRNIESSGRHLLVLINDILDLSKVESGLMELQPEIVAIADVCEASLLFVKEQAIKKQLRLGVQLSDQLAIVQADPKRLKQMLVNLLSNAVKFTEKGGQVRLAVNADAEAGVVHFAVEDTGIGITPEGMARLFHPFVQLDSSLSRLHEGTGLGLALVRRLAELHGGSISVESVAGKGSRFTIALPYPPPAKAEVRSDLSSVGIVGVSMLRSAVVIEDSATAGEQIVRYLEELNIHAVICSHSADALAQVADLLPDAIFLDLQMPNQSGWQVLADLKADPHLRTIPVIIISVVDERARGLAAGAVEYLVKPISREILRQALRVLVSGPERTSAARIIAAQTAVSTNVRVLLAEDNEVNIIATGDYLQDCGYHVLVARNGREVLDMIGDVRPDIILMDIQMPEMDGLEATRRLRAMPGYAGTPIIALTALAMPGDRERCLAAGASEYLTKPVSLKRLVATIQQLVDA